MSYIPSDNKLVTCPYDEAHKVKESRLQLHIAKCKTNHLDLEKKVCPFNAQHLLLQGEFDHHLINCPDRGSLDRQLAQAVDKNNPYKGRTDVPKYSDPLIMDEHWDDEEATTTQLPPAPIGAVIEPPPMLKPAQRRKLYQELHQVPKAFEKNVAESVSSKPSPRQPKQLSETQILQTAQPNAQMMQSLGLGRGKPPSRIAANFQSATSQSSSYSNIVKDMSNLGLGRGQPVDKGPTPVFNGFDDDFPALGCGRGSFAPSKSHRTPGFKFEK